MSQTVLITGSSRGIGLAIARQLFKQGFKVILNSRSKIASDIWKEFVEQDSERVMQVNGDISDFNQAKEMVKAVVERFGTIDILINNAGITHDGLIMRMKEEDFDQVLTTNLKGSFNMCRHIAPIMLKQKQGTIINMSSVVGMTGNIGQSNYAASKAGIIGLTKSLAQELASRSITVNAIAPGFIDTEMTAALSDKIKEQYLSQVPLRRFGDVQEIAQTVQFLIENRYITGQVIEVNGGLHM